MSDNMLFDLGFEEKKTGPVKCLGVEFENDEARRDHFTEELRKKLQDPEFRKIEGFPIGSDEDILNLSDPPYYTACPNPWIGDFIAEWGGGRLKNQMAPVIIENHLQRMLAKENTTQYTNTIHIQQRCHTRQ